MTVRLETPRLILRPPIEADLDAWAAMDEEEETKRFIGGVKTRYDAWQGMATVAGMWALKGCGLFSVLEKDGGRWVGRIGPWIPEGAIGTEIGWALSTAAHGKGYATEGARAAMDWAFAHLGWTEVIHCIDAKNTASIAVAHRLGSRWLRTGREVNGDVVEVYGQDRPA